MNANKIHIKINNRVFEAAEGETVLQVARRNGIEIPALCHHDAVEPEGACRLCTVEVTHPDWKGGRDFVTACLYPVKDGLEVLTHSEEVIAIRRDIVDLLLARCPDTPLVKELAAGFGIKETSYERRVDPDDCILCGLCTRICSELGFHAISAAGRGAEREITPPLKEAPPDCTGCLACAHICPTGHIRYEITKDEIKIWGRSFPLKKCSVCGAPIISEAYASAVIKRQGLPADAMDVCDVCRRKEQVEKMDGVVQAASAAAEV